MENSDIVLDKEIRLNIINTNKLVDSYFPPGVNYIINLLIYKLKSSYNYLPLLLFITHAYNNPSNHIPHT